MTIAEYKAQLTSEFMRSEDAAAMYGFEVGGDFYSYFSRVSVESVLFGMVAMRDYVMGELFNTYKKEIATKMDQILPHRPKWYADKALNFMYDTQLVTDSDVYDTTGMSESDIAEAKIIRHAVAVENADASVLTIKVAGEVNDKRAPISAKAEAMLVGYLQEIKDAGVRIELVNREGDKYRCSMKIHYNVQKEPTGVESDCKEVIEDYLANLPFNGRYSNQTLVDKLQMVDGVMEVELYAAESCDSLSSNFTTISAWCVPVAGYFIAENIDIELTPYM